MTTIALFVCIILVFLYVFFVDSKTKHLDFLQEFAEKHNNNVKDLEEMRKLVLEMFEKHNGLITVIEKIAEKQEELIKKHNLMDEHNSNVVDKYNENVELINDVLIPNHNNLAADFAILQNNFNQLVEFLQKVEEELEK